MANQYSGSFEHIIREKFVCSAREALEHCASDELSYADAAEKLGFKHGTIRKWAKRLDIKLKSGEPVRMKPEQFMRFFKAKNLNKYNLLSRKWLFKPSAAKLCYA